MRLRSLFAAALLAAMAVAVSTTASPALAAPAGCNDGPKGFVMSCDQFRSTAGPRGAIGLIGDSVLLGSNDGVSNPGLPTLLAAAGWGPVRMTTSLGMRTRNDTTPGASAYHLLSNWQAAGFRPSVVVVNLGANHIGDCTPATVAVCKSRIDVLLDRIASLYPAATVWWAKTLHETYGTGTGYSPGMLGWNLALDLAAAQRKNLVVWDWPNAVATADPPILMDTVNVHPRSGVEYVKRSTLIVADLRRTMPAHFSGPAATLPDPAGVAGFEYFPATPESLYSTVPAEVPALAPGTVKDIALGANPSLPDGAAAVAVTVTASGARAGSVTVYRCGATRPSAPSVVFGAGQRRSAQAIVRLGAGRHLCVGSSTTADVAVWLQGTFATPSPSGQTLGMFPSAVHTTTPTITVPPAGFVDRALALPYAASGAALTLTVTNPSGQGSATLHRCGTTPPAALHVAFSAGSTTSASAFVPTAAATATKVCVRVRMAPGATFSLANDVAGLFRVNDLGARYRPAVTPKRLLDTRDATRVGGWYGRHVPTLVIGVPAAPAGAKAATGNLQLVGPLAAGRATLYGCTATRPKGATVSVGAGATVLGGGTTSLTSKGRLCITTSTSTNTVFDLSGWWVAPT